MPARMDFATKQGTGNLPKMQITILEPAACQEKEMNESERRIMIVLCSGLTQSDASRILNIPKSTVNRTTCSLLSDGIIRKKGNRNYAILYEPGDANKEGLLKQGAGKGYKRVCQNCNQEFWTDYANQKFCDPLCWGESRQGPKHQNWTGGDPYNPYCYKFNDSLKERVRAFFQHRCVLCGKDERDNLDRKGHHHKLRIHHVNYNPRACCEGADAPEDKKFVPLCLSCHSKTSKPKYKKEWQEYLTRFIDVVYDGKCYFTKEEMRPQDQYYKF